MCVCVNISVILQDLCPVQHVPTHCFILKKHPSLIGKVLLKQRRMIGCHFVTQGSRWGNSQYELVGTRRIWICLPLIQWKRSTPKLWYVKRISICVLFMQAPWAESHATHTIEETFRPSGNFSSPE